MFVTTEKKEESGQQTMMGCPVGRTTRVRNLDLICSGLQIERTSTHKKL
jgi:hypothetical protein